MRIKNEPGRQIEKLAKVLQKDTTRQIGVLILFTLLSAVLTYPLVFTSFSKLPGSEDVYQAVWYFWETGQAVDRLINGGPISSLSFTDYIYYPGGTPILPFSMAYSQLMAVLLMPLAGVNLTLNFLYFSSFVLSGFGAYLLVRHVTRDESASVVAGCIYTFAPYHFEHAFVGHVGSVTMQWIPFCALFLLKMVESKKMSDAALAAVFFILVAASDMQYMVFMGTFVMLFLAYQLISGGLKIEKRDITAVAVFLMISLLVIIPMNLSAITTAMSSDNYLYLGDSSAADGSVDLFNFIVPSVTHPLFGSWIKENYYDKMEATRITWERVAFMGFSVLFLVIFASVRERSKKLLFWQLSALFFAVMSLGPVLHFFGQTVFFGREIALPYSVLSHLIPGLSNSRTPGRFEVITLLSVAVIAGAGISRLKRDVGSLCPEKGAYRKMQALVTVILMVLVLFEYLAIPFVTSDTAIPEFYYTLAKEPGDFAIMEIPSTVNYSAGIMAEYYQTVHHKKLVGGQLARVPPSSTDFERNMPFVADITYPESAGDLFGQNVTDIATSVLDNNNIRYVIIHKKYLSNEQYAKITDLSEEALGAEIYSDDRMVVYHVDDGNDMPYAWLGSNWYPVENWSGTTACWMKNNATIEIIAGNNTHAQLYLTAYSFNIDRTLYIYKDGTLLSRNKIAPGGTSVYLNVNLSKEKNELMMYTPEGHERPMDILLNNTDNRQLSIALANCSIKFYNE